MCLYVCITFLLVLTWAEQYLKCLLSSQYTHGVNTAKDVHVLQLTSMHRCGSGKRHSLTLRSLTLYMYVYTIHLYIASHILI